MTGVRERLFETGTVVINYAEGPPTGPLFVIRHGGSTRWQYASAFIEALLPRYHVYAPDLRGHGKSGWAPGSYRLRHFAVDIAAFISDVAGEPEIAPFLEGVQVRHDTLIR